MKIKELLIIKLIQSKLRFKKNKKNNNKKLAD